MSTLKRFHRLMRQDLAGQNARRQQDRGMTLLEIMVVITIIGVVMATVTVAVLPQLDKAKVDTTINSMRGVQGALKLYYARHGKYPDTSQGFQILVTEKFLDQTPKDAWGNDFIYTAESSSYKIISYGSDGQQGGDGAGSDIASDTLGQEKK
ncbi:MAG: type II secretion system protein GspG [Myxococcales bacterium]